MPNFNVIIIDDDYISNIITENVIKRVNLSAQSQVFQDAREALTVIKKIRNTSTFGRAIDLVFLDMFMPIMDGFEFLEELQKLAEKDGRELAVVLLSGSEIPFSKSSFVKYPFVKAQLLKPLTEKSVEQVLEKIAGSEGRC